MADSIPIDLDQLDRCKRCARLQRQFKRLRIEYPDYWNRPVSPSGPDDARLLIVGLAPGMHGANRTGIPFMGDASGELLFTVLRQLGIDQAVRITNVVKCLPISNLPAASEVNACQRFLGKEVHHQNTLLVLVGVAHVACVRCFGARQADHPFVHGAVHTLDAATLIDSYHCSRYNTQTGRLTQTMFHEVVKSAARHAGLLD
ncbi:MAG: uracil-DNA glycosylase family protein [Pseudomonadales bacterium]